MSTYRTKPMASKGRVVQIFQSKTAQARLLTNYMSEGLLNNEAVIVIARPPLRKAIWAKLLALDLDMAAYKARGQFKWFDAELLLSAILIDNVIDEHCFQTFVGSQIEAAHAAYGKVRAFGEMTEILLQSGLPETAVQLGNIRNELCKKHEFTVLCTPSPFASGPSCHGNTHSPTVNPESGSTLLELFGTAWTHTMDALVQPQPESSHASSPSH